MTIFFSISIHKVLTTTVSSLWCQNDTKKMFINSYLILWSITSFPNGCLGFLSQKAFINHYDVLSSNDVRFPPLEAKASKKKRKSKTSSGSGFARVVEKDTEESNEMKKSWMGIASVKTKRKRESLRRRQDVTRT